MTDTRTIIELATLIGGIITAVYGSISSIRKRREDDAALTKAAGANRISYAKAVEDISGLDPSYVQQVAANMATVEAKLAQAEELLRSHGIVKDKPLG